MIVSTTTSSLTRDRENVTSVDICFKQAFKVKVNQLFTLLARLNAFFKLSLKHLLKLELTNYLKGS